MMRLENLQILFQNHVVSGDDAAVPAFVGDAVASTEERLGVYYEAYRLRLLEILRDDFPGLCGILSADEFELLGLRYIDAHPSDHPSVRQFGRHLAEYLERDGDYTTRPYLAEMARFEWARGLAFDGPDAELRTLGELGTLPGEDWPALQVQFHPTLQRSRFAWNIGPIWRAVNAGKSAPQPARLDRTEPWIVWRRGITVYWRSLDEIESSAMDAFAVGRDFADVCAVLCEFLDAETIPARMAGMLNQWVTEGLVIRA